MQSKAKTPDEYIANLPEDRKAIISDIRNTINKNIPKGFMEVMCYGMIGWVAPHEIFPPGYHCDPTKPLMLINLGSQKNYVSLYHMGLYPGRLLDWFQAEWPKATTRKLDMGKCCIRFKKLDQIPVDLIGRLASKLNPRQWVEAYEKALKR